MKNLLLYLCLFVFGLSSVVGCTTSSGGDDDPAATVVYYQEDGAPNRIVSYTISSAATASVTTEDEIGKVEFAPATDDLYYTTQTDTIVRRFTSAGVTNDVETGLISVSHLFYANSKIYFWDDEFADNSALHSDVADGSSADVVASSDAIGSSISGLAVGATTGYILENIGANDLDLFNATLSDGTVTSSATVDAFASLGVAAFDKATSKWYVYDTDADEVSSFATDGSGLTEVLTGLTTDLTAIAVYNGTVFYAVDDVLYSATSDTDKAALVTANGNINSITLDYE